MTQFQHYHQEGCMGLPSFRKFGSFVKCSEVQAWEIPHLCIYITGKFVRRAGSAVDAWRSTTAKLSFVYKRGEYIKHNLSFYVFPATKRLRLESRFPYPPNCFDVIKGRWGLLVEASPNGTKMHMQEPDWAILLLTFVCFAVAIFMSSRL